MVTEDVAGVSRVAIPDFVRVLRGPKNALFFGIDASTGEQIKLRLVGFGAIGQKGIWRDTPLR